jgi:hypothetical protein
MRLVLGVLQGQNDPIPQVSFDQITCYSTSFPTIDDVQWNDFPGGRTIEFSDRIWRVKGPGFYGPGPNNFSDSEQSVWVDDLERLHMTIRQIGGAWNSTEVTLVDPLGYGDYIFTTQGALDQLDTRTVLDCSSGNTTHTGMPLMDGGILTMSLISNTAVGVALITRSANLWLNPGIGLVTSFVMEPASVPPKSPAMPFAGFLIELSAVPGVVVLPMNLLPV